MDTRDTRFQNLLFLLSAAPLGVGCIITDGDDESDTEAATTDTPTTDDPTAGTTAPPDTDTTPMTDGMTGSTGPGVDSSTGPGVDSSTGPGVDSTTGGELPPICATYGDAITLCYTDKAGAAAAQACVETLAYYEMMYGAECVAAFEDWLTCLSALTCEELMGKEVCTAEDMAIMMACAAK